MDFETFLNESILHGPGHNSPIALHPNVKLSDNKTHHTNYDKFKSHLKKVAKDNHDDDVEHSMSSAEHKAHDAKGKLIAHWDHSKKSGWVEH